MHIGSHEFVTPFECSYAYDADWRHRAAMGAAGAPGDAPPDLRRDTFLREQLHYINGGSIDKEARPNKRLMFPPANGGSTRAQLRRSVEEANTIFDMSHDIVLKDKLEAMLLCEDLTFEDISTYTGLREVVVKAFERLFFNVRDSTTNKLSLGMWVREHFAIGNVDYIDPEDKPAYWRTIAMTSGSRMLLADWGWTPPEDLPEAEVNLIVFRNLMLSLDRRIRFGKIDAKASMDMMGRMKELIDDMRARGVISSTDSSSEVSMIFKLLAETAPTPPEPTEAHLTNKAEDVRGKLAAIQRKFDGVNAKTSLGQLNKTTPLK